MLKVFLHTHDKHEDNWVNGYYNFQRVPIEGEYLATSSDSDWYEVELVVHTPFSEEISAEVYAVAVDHSKIKQAKLKTRAGTTFK